MKKRLSGLLLLCMFSSALQAQNNAIFYGGPGDGWTQASFAQSAPNILLGGAGDGWSVANYAQQTPNILLGGGGDGWSNNSYAQSIANIYNGGAGDGWSFTNYAQAVPNIFTGGAGDGWMFNNYEQPSPNINTGGFGDGWNSGNYEQASVNINLGGSGDGWASTYVPTTPLPFTFLKFDAAKDGNTAMLNWKMADDKDVAFFEVQRSATAVSFATIGSVNQSASAALSYAFRDEQPNTGSNYYRLKIHERNGKTSFTPTRVVRFDAPEAAVVKVYPVPAFTTVNIDFPESYLGKATVLNMFSVSGVMVRQMKLMPLKALKVEMNIGDLADGDYFIHIAGDGIPTQSVKVMKLSK